MAVEETRIIAAHVTVSVYDNQLSCSITERTENARYAATVNDVVLQHLLAILAGLRFIDV